MLAASALPATPLSLGARGRSCCLPPPAPAPLLTRPPWSLQDIALLDYSMLQFTPSATAASALTLAMQLHSPAPRPAVHDAAIHYEAGSCDDAADMEQLLGYSPAQLAPCVRALHQLHWAAVRPATPADRDLVTPVCTRCAAVRGRGRCHVPACGTMHGRAPCPVGQRHG